jgi:uncharacterized protein (DUF1501 family)
MMMNRRQFFATASAATLMTPSIRWAKAAGPVAKPLIVVFLRGGMDSLNVLAPAGDKQLLSARPPALRVADVGVEKGIEIDGLKGADSFVLNTTAAPLSDLFKKKQLSFIPASGLHHATRSHFQAMDFMERGLSTDKQASPRDGWLTRASLAMGEAEPGSIVCMGSALPQSLSLCEDALPVSDIWDIDWMPSDAFREALFEVHTGEGGLDVSSRQAIDATTRLAKKLERSADNQPILRDPPKGIAYPDGEFGRKLHFLAEMLRMAPDISMATADLDGWDTHESQADRLPGLLNELSKSLAAFHDHLDAIDRAATVVVMSEFGRRLKANESSGTDHGHGGMMMVMGDGVAGGQMLGKWPGLETSQLDEGMDLAVTTDFRDVLATVLHTRGADAAVSAAFPGHKPSYVQGLMKA